MVRFGIVGVGNMGSAHTKWLPEIQGAELTAVCDIDPAKLDAIHSCQKFLDSAELIRSGTVDAVLIATPHYFHTTIGIDALKSGLHVLLEKPISVHKADCLKLIEAYQGRENQIFGAMFNQRTDPHYQAIRDLVKSGALGPLQRVSWIITDWFRTETYYASGGWRATWAGEGGGVLLNQCPHNLDLLQWIVGMPSKVTAHCGFGKYHDIEVEDEVTAFLEYPNGATGVFVTTTGEAPGTNRLEIVGDLGKVVYENGSILHTQTESSVQEVNRTSPHSFASVPSSTTEITAEGHGGQHREVLQNFVNAIKFGEKLIAPAIEGIHSVELANAMIYSGLTGETVALPLDPARYEAKLTDLIANSKPRTRIVDPATVDMAASFGR